MSGTRHTSCTVCGLSRAAAAEGECNIPMPRPQVPQCLMVTLEREEFREALAKSYVDEHEDQA